MYRPAVVFADPLTDEQKLEQYGDSAYILDNKITYYYVGWLTEEEAKQIRTIALNGYWGTVGSQTDADGNTKLDDNGNPVPKLGSLEAMKQMLLSSGEFTETELESLNDGVAMTATQMAIWSCSNKASGIQFVNSHYGMNSNGNVPADKEDEVKLKKTAIIPITWIPILTMMHMSPT